MNSSINKGPKKTSRKWMFTWIQPLSLVLLGGILTLLGQVTTSYSAFSKFKYESSLNRRAEAMLFLDMFSSIMGERLYAASDYYWAIQSGENEAIIKEKRDEFFGHRKNAIIKEGVFINRGADYFGDEFKDTLYKKLFVVLQDMDVQIQVYANTRLVEDANRFEELEREANRLSGALLGIASRKMEGSEFKPPSLHQ